MSYYIGILDGSDDVWGVRIPDLRGVYGGGATPEEAMADVISAAIDWAEHRKAAGLGIPEPRKLEDVAKDPDTEIADGDRLVMIPLLVDAGRTVRANLTLDAGLLDAVDAEAKRRGLTRSAFMASAARDKIKMCA